jgi:beta-glucanase (GH16 family)
MGPVFPMVAASQFTVTNSTYSGPVQRPRNVTLLWRDEFNGTALHSRKWQYDTSRNKRGWYNRELGYYSAGQNLSVADGLLKIEARHEKLDRQRFPDWDGQEYTSARIFSKGAGWTYRFFEVRAKLPCARGTWPAIWMLPVEMKNWPDGGEIDIMEQVGAEPNRIYASLHTKLFNHLIKTQRSAQKRVPTSCSTFHVYQLGWQPDRIAIGVDGHGILRVLNDRPGGKGAWPFTTPFKMILNLAIRGDWAAAKGIDNAACPSACRSRVWQAPRGARR